MYTRPEILSAIQHCHAFAGLPAALELTRSSFTAGQIDPGDLSEILLALRAGSWRHFENRGRLPRTDGLASAAAA